MSEPVTGVVSSEEVASLLVEALRQLRRARLETRAFRELASVALGRVWALQHSVEGLRRTIETIQPGTRRLR